MRIGAIDIGTNTALFVIAEIGRDGSIRTMHEDHEIIRLGQNVDAGKRILPEALERCVPVLERFRKKSEAMQCQSLLVAGTSAIRDAVNREWFTEEIRKRTGVEIRALSGEEEALCTYLGGRLTLGDSEKAQPAFVIDIGGGSTEIVRGDHQNIHFKISLDIGAVRLTERFLKNDPVDANEESALRGYCRGVLRQLLSDLSGKEQIPVIGVAGTVTTLAAMIREMAVYQPERINGFQIRIQDLQDQIARLRKLTIEERKSIPGLEPKRADVIFAGAVILEELMTYAGWPLVMTSNYGLRYGLILRAIHSGG